MQPTIEQFIRTGALPAHSLDGLSRADLESLLVDVCTVERNARNMLKNRVAKAAASDMILNCESASKQIVEAHKNLSRR